MTGSVVSVKLNARVRLRILMLFLLLSCVFVPVPEAAMEGLKTEDLAQQSDIVITGDVEQVSSQWTEDGRKIITRATVVVTLIVRGTVQQQRVTVEYDGGEIGNKGLKVSDVQPLLQGEKVLLFLKRSPGHGNDIHKIVGKAQGKYTIDEQGIARKKGFHLVGGEKNIDNDIPVQQLIQKIQSVP